MKHHRLIVLALLGTLALGGCRRTPPEPPGPTPEETAEQERLAREAAEQRAARERAEREAREAAERAARERAEREAREREARMIIQEMVHFDFDRFNIRPGDAETLTRKVGVLRANPSVRLRISGHADERGSAEYNLALGMRRATAARDFLVQYGIDAGRLEVVSFGEERPVRRESNEEAWAMNRRAEFEITGGTIAGGQ